MRLDQARSYAVQQPYISTLHMFTQCAPMRDASADAGATLDHRIGADAGARIDSRPPPHVAVGWIPAAAFGLRSNRCDRLA